MNAYYFVKILHILSACALIGLPFASAWYLFCLRHQNNLTMLLKGSKQTLALNIWLVSLLGLLQPITGFSMIFLKTQLYSWQWIAASLAVYALAAVSWFCVIYFQTLSTRKIHAAIASKSALCKDYYRYIKLRIVFGGLALVSILSAFLIMTSKK